MVPKIDATLQIAPLPRLRFRAPCPIRRVRIHRSQFIITGCESAGDDGPVKLLKLRSPTGLTFLSDAGDSIHDQRARVGISEEIERSQ